MSAVPDRTACDLTRAAPICRDALSGTLIDIGYSLSTRMSSDSFNGSCFGATEPTPVGLSWRSKTAEPKGYAVPDARTPGGRSHAPYRVDASTPTVNQVLDSPGSSDLEMLVSGAIDPSDVRAI